MNLTIKKIYKSFGKFIKNIPKRIAVGCLLIFIGWGIGLFQLFSVTYLQYEKEIMELYTLGIMTLFLGAFLIISFLVNDEFKIKNIMIRILLSIVLSIPLASILAFPLYIRL